MSVNISHIIQESSMLLEGVLGFPTSTVDCLLPFIEETPKDSHSKDISDTVTTWINKNFKVTDKACSQIFHNSHGFFGIVNKSNTLTDFAPFEYDSGFWGFITKQHVILSTYAKIRKLAAAMIPQNDYDFAKLLNPCKVTDAELKFGENKYGLTFLVENEYNSKDSQLSTINSSCLFANKPAYGKLAWERDKNISKKTKDLFEELEDLFDLGCIEPYDKSIYSTKQHQQGRTLPLSGEELKKATAEIENENQYVQLLQLNTLELQQIIIGRKENNKYKNIKPIINAHKTPNDIPSNYKTACKTLLSYIQIPGYQYSEGNTYETNFSLADKIYTRYLVEKIFAITTMNYLDDILEKDPNKDILHKEFRKLSMAFLLPNPFSRDLIVQMAIDSLNYDYREKLQQDPLNKQAVAFSVPELPATQNIYEKDVLWADRFTDMINVLQKYTFPVYENHYFLQLWKNSRPLCSSDIECIDLLFRILSSYLNNEENAEELLSLSTFMKNSRPNRLDGLQVIGQYKINLDKFEKDSLQHRPSSKCIKALKWSQRVSSEIEDFIKVNYLEYLKPGITKFIRQSLYNGAIETNTSRS